MIDMMYVLDSELYIFQAGVELGLTQAETVSLELGLIKGLTKIS